MKNKTEKLSTTLADLVISARLAAQKAFALKEPFAQQSLKLDEFKAGGFDAGDFPTWETAFNSELEMLGHFSKQPSPATEAANKAAALAAAEAKAKADEAVEDAAKAAKAPTGNPLN